ncbi:hypothetical protein HUN08_10485 [Gordonia sp. X0973]|uniref:hypothetical protein n=1 Tax=Gordonia sp. X0973 TaxID=2742602 RepID=UPI000F52354A|nr:hypothetical protein [Gordonia sp. X0973]QKT07570.1 hypothetical protein HUN08_10485 [Gordonia sp. X0973]
MLVAAILAALTAFGLLVAGLLTGHVWLAVACVVASAIGLILLLVDTRRTARANPVEEAPTTGAFLGEDVAAYAAQREAKRDAGAYADVAGTGALSMGNTGSHTRIGPRTGEFPAARHGVREGEAPASGQFAAPRRPAPPGSGWTTTSTAAPVGDTAAAAGFRDPEPDFTGPIPVFGGGAAPAPAPAAQPAPPAESDPAFTLLTVETVNQPPAPAPGSRPVPTWERTEAPQPPVHPPGQQPPAQQPPVPQPAVPQPAAQQPPAQSSTAAWPTPASTGRAPRVGDLHDYVTSTGSIPRIETTGSIPKVVGDSEEVSGIRWESSIPPTSGSGLVADESRAAIAHVNDIPSNPVGRRARRRPPSEEAARPIDPLDPNWRPPSN